MKAWTFKAPLGWMVGISTVDTEDCPTTYTEEGAQEAADLLNERLAELARLREELAWMREREAVSVPPETFKAVRERAEKAEARLRKLESDEALDRAARVIADDAASLYLVRKRPRHDHWRAVALAARGALLEGGEQ